MKRLCLFVLLVTLPAVTAFGQYAGNGLESKKSALSSLSSMPLCFTRNQGQFGEKTLFKSQANGVAFYFCRGEVAYVFTRDTKRLREKEDDMPGIPLEIKKLRGPLYEKESILLKAEFVGANRDAQVTGENRLAHNCNYFYGSDPAQWHTDVPNYSSITYRDIYPGVDLKYRGEGNSMKYDFIVSPGADPSQIHIRYNGAARLAISNSGDLEVETSFGRLYEKIPYIYQEIDGAKRQVRGRYSLTDGETFSFLIDESYNPNHPLIIDPDLLYSTYLGGSDSESGQDIEVDALGNAYITGFTYSDNFPPAMPYSGYHGASGYTDIFVTKISPTGNSLVFSTYLGGSLDDVGRGIKVDVDNYAYITGSEKSIDFPTVNGRTYPYGPEDIFVTRLMPAGNVLSYSRLYGGNGSDEANDIDLRFDTYGDYAATVIGQTNSTEDIYPNIPGDFYRGGAWDAFIVKFDRLGWNVLHFEFIGGAGTDVAMAIDDEYIAGWTTSEDLVLPDAPDPTFGGLIEGFVGGFHSHNGYWIDVFTYLGGSGFDFAFGVDTDGDGIYVTGMTYSTDFPTTSGAYNEVYNGGETDAFITKMNLDYNGYYITYSSYLGGSGTDGAFDIDTPQWNPYVGAMVTGETNSPYFPEVNQYGNGFNGGPVDAFVTYLSADGSSLVYSTYLGGDGEDWGLDICADNSGYAYVTGYSTSTNFPMVNPISGFVGGNDVFVTKLANIAQPGQGDYALGDANGNGVFNGIDVAFSVSYLKGVGVPPELYFCPPHGPIYAAADANGNCQFNGIDVSYSVTYLKGNGAAPTACPDCLPGD